MPAKQSLTWNTTLYLFLEPVMQPLDENWMTLTSTGHPWP